MKLAPVPREPHQPLLYLLLESLALETEIAVITIRHKERLVVNSKLHHLYQKRKYWHGIHHNINEIGNKMGTQYSKLLNLMRSRGNDFNVVETCSSQTETEQWPITVQFGPV